MRWRSGHELKFESSRLGIQSEHPHEQSQFVLEPPELVALVCVFPAFGESVHDTCVEGEGEWRVNFPNLELADVELLVQLLECFLVKHALDGLYCFLEELDLGTRLLHLLIFEINNN